MIYIILFIIFLIIIVSTSLFHHKTTSLHKKFDTIIKSPEDTSNTQEITHTITTELPIKTSENNLLSQNLSSTLPLTLLPLISTTTTTSICEPQNEIINNTESSTIENTKSFTQSPRRKKALLSIKNKQSPRQFKK